MAVAVKRCVGVLITDETVVCAVKCAGGETAVFSPEDAAFVSRHYWSRTPGGYVKRANSAFGKSAIRMHRDVLERAGVDLTDRQVDHVDGDKLDNRREKLRACTATQNRQNMPAMRNNKLGVRGVRKIGNRYTATIRVGRRNVHLGYFKTLRGAAEARKCAELKHFGEFSVLNRGDQNG